MVATLDSIVKGRGPLLLPNEPGGTLFCNRPMNSGCKTSFMSSSSSRNSFVKVLANKVDFLSTSVWVLGALRVLNSTSPALRLFVGAFEKMDRLRFSTLSGEDALEGEGLVRDRDGALISLREDSECSEVTGEELVFS